MSLEKNSNLEKNNKK